MGYELDGGHTGKQVWGPTPHAAEDICVGLDAQSQKDGKPWNKLCVKANGTITRVLSPGVHMQKNPDAFEGYFDEYGRAVYKQWNITPRVYNLGNLGNMTCVGSADGNSASCNGRPYYLPTAADVFGCASGPFAAVAPGTPHEALRAPFCADFNRGTALSSTDPESPRNWYAAIAHKFIRIVYAFPFDDVRVNGIARDSTLTSSDSTGLIINVGGTWPQ